MIQPQPLRAPAFRVGPWGSPAPSRARYLAELTIHLVARQLSSRYRRSLLGWLWALALPVAQLAVFNLVFTQIVPVGVRDYPAFLFIGIIAWAWLATSLTLAASSIESRRDLVLRPGFPTPLLPVVATIVALVDYVIALPLVLGLVAVYAGMSPAVLLLPVLLLIQLVLLVGLGWLVSPLNVFFRDVAHVVGLALLLGYFLTPIFYSRASTPSSLSLVFELNPMARLIDAQRSILLDGRLPAAGPLLAVAGGAVLVAGAGYAVFALIRPSLPDQL